MFRCSIAIFRNLHTLETVLLDLYSNIVRSKVSKAKSYNKNYYNAINSRFDRGLLLSIFKREKFYCYIRVIYS